jgi:hypothetical protein
MNTERKVGGKWSVLADGASVIMLSLSAVIGVNNLILHRQKMAILLLVLWAFLAVFTTLKSFALHRLLRSQQLLIDQLLRQEGHQIPWAEELVHPQVGDEQR